MNTASKPRDEDRVAGACWPAGGLHRPRLEAVLNTLATKHLGLVLAPPGSGKTTLISSWARGFGVTVAWCPGEELAHRGEAILSELAARSTAEPALAAQHGTRPSLVIVLEDLHLLAGSAAERAVSMFLGRLPPGVRVVVSGRQVPDLSLSRFRLEEDLVEVGPDDLRFRIWETEALFRDHYRCPMLPEELSTLTARTDGWAAGIQLFHLAARDCSPAERTRLLSGFGARSRPVTEYLAENVLTSLDPQLVEFMVRTSALGVLTGELCDQLLGTSGSSAILAELERRQLFVSRVGESDSSAGDAYRYHTILRAYLDGCLVAELGEAGARAWHYKVALLLLGGAQLEEALPSFCRAEAWGKVGAVLARLNLESPVISGPALICGSTMDVVPQHILNSDPWVALARARCHLASGQLEAALALYRQCEPALPSRGADTCRAEMLAVSAWANPLPTPAPEWTNVLRRAMAFDPLQAARSPKGPNGEVAPAVTGGLEMLVEGLSMLAAGRTGAAAPLLLSAAQQVSSPVAGLGARLGALLADLLGRRDPASLEAGGRRARAMAAEAERLGCPWLARQAYALLSLVGTPSVAGQVARQCIQDGDPWGAALARLLEVAGRLELGKDPVEACSVAASAFRALGASTLEAWALACQALAEARSDHPGAEQVCRAAEAIARRAGVPGASALAHLALGQLADDTSSRSRRADHLRLARLLARDCGLGILEVPPRSPKQLAAARNVLAGPSPEGPGTTGVLPTPHLASCRPVATSAGQPQDRSLSVSCFGRLVARRGEEALDLGELRPRVRALLALLAVRQPHAVHREVLIEALWPESDPRSSGHCLQTAVSSLRRALASGEACSNVVARHGEAYLLVGARVDVAELREALVRAAAARRAGDSESEAGALRRALAMRPDELLEELGPADWVVREREDLRWDMVAAAERLADLELAAGRPHDALSAARRGLDMDPYRESMWRLAGRAAQAADDQGLRAQLERGRADALAELGLII